MKTQTEHTTPIRSSRDPGNPITGIIALVSAVLLFGIVAIGQNTKPAKPETDPPAAESAIAPSLEADLAYRVSIKFHRWVQADPAAERALETYARTTTERLCLAVVIGELKDANAAADRLHSLANSTPGEGVELDARLLARVYEHSASQAEPRDPVLAGILDESQRADLESRHGFYARVALTHSLPDSDPQRLEPRSGGWTFILITFMMLGILGAIVLGGVLFILAMIFLGLGRLKPAMPRAIPGGSAFLEVFSIFVGLFLLIKVIVDLLDKHTSISDAALLFIALGLQWSLLLVPAWPLLRGMSLTHWKHAIGLTAPKGIAREIGAGIVGYIAGLPVFVAGVIAVLVLMALKTFLSGIETEPPANPMIELMASKNALVVILFALTAVIWAPLCEELVFRGALMRHMSGRLPLILAAFVTAVLFAFMHNYGPMLTPPLIALGFVFAMMRIWRGSIIACITAHALHNGTLVLLVIMLLRTIGD
ncbi:MAG: CPBP family intramembrane metalloprotease [Phycisphaeraceae bacterium]|nr:CPBP family intramembrane metalloprotease [Phycisphaeraceae bacterium]MCW5761660.1 CPBP family intramembrane metalloprotease [Phycisphaeraceae bacterium]